MIAMTTIRVRNEITGRVEDVVDRAFDLDTDRAVVVPCEPPQGLGARWDDNLGLWVLPEMTPKFDPRARG